MNADNYCTIGAANPQLGPIIDKDTEIATLRERVRELEAENKRLREALENLIQRANESGIGEMGLIDTIHAMHKIAREALKEATHEPKSE